MRVLEVLQKTKQATKTGIFLSLVTRNTFRIFWFLFSFFLLCFRAGLMHILRGLPGTAIPTDIAKIKPFIAIVELDDIGGGAVHAVVGNMFCKEKACFYEGFSRRLSVSKN